MYFLQPQERDVTCGYTDDIVEKSYDCYSLLLVMVIVHNTVICKTCCLISFCVNARLNFLLLLRKDARRNSSSKFKPPGSEMQSHGF